MEIKTIKELYDNIGMPIRVSLRTYCVRCGNDLTDNPMIEAFHSCPTCDAWTSNVTVKNMTALFTDMT